jgi:hypothetical protein
MQLESGSNPKLKLILKNHQNQCHVITTRGKHCSVKTKLGETLCYRHCITNLNTCQSERFISNARTTHGYRYDYSLINYVNSRTIITIICKIHGSFEQRPDTHLAGHGCPHCGKVMQGKTTAQFIIEAHNIHGDLYDYSQTNYINSYTNVTIICKIHGLFNQNPSKHLSGCGCNSCGLMSKKGKKSITTEEFIIKANLIHNDTYGYSLVNYVNSKTKIYIICKIHGPFEQRPDQHLAGRGCPRCGKNKQRKTTEQFIIDAHNTHGDLYDYSQTNYINSYTNIIINCKIHGPFNQCPNEHTRGRGCPKCGYSKCSGFKTRKTSEQFITDAKNIHDETYDYSHVNYINANSKITIICKIHGPFEQTPACHLKGQGCSSCAKMGKLKEEFIQDAIKIHGNIYDYSYVQYINAITNVKITCNLHGEFEQRPSNHLIGHGCDQCAKMGKSTEDFIKTAVKKHGNIYDYSQVNYINNKTDVIIICKTHGPFEQRPNTHLSGSGCPHMEHKVKTNEQFINEAKLAHGDKYDYSQVKYTNTETKIVIICKIHGPFEQRPNTHLSGSGCPHMEHRVKTNEQFIYEAKLVHGDKYDYSQVKYINHFTKIVIICKTHGSFEQRPSNHLSGSGCSACVLKGEQKLYEYLVNHYPSTRRQFKPVWCINPQTGHNLSFDFVIDEYKIIIELDGEQHFKQVANWTPLQKIQTIDKYKLLRAWNNDYSVIRLLQSEVLNNRIDLDNELLQLICPHEYPSLSCLYKSENNEHDIYNVFYEEYMVNPYIINIEEDLLEMLTDLEKPLDYED